jgi:membrane protein YqaA with SNARE-associated domain
MKLQERLKGWFTTLQKYADRWWYAPVIGLLAAADLFLVVIPTDGLLIGAVMLSPRRWIYSALMVSLGSALGCVALAHLIQVHGMPFLLSIVPGIQANSTWTWTNELMDKWGTWAVFLVALSPMMQHPAIALAALAGMPLANIAGFAFAGRILKYLMLAYLGTHAPGVLGKFWGLQHELEEVGLKDEIMHANDTDQGLKGTHEAKSPKP